MGLLTDGNHGRLTLYINATNVHGGGGGALLTGLLVSDFDAAQICVAVDSRFPMPPTVRSNVLVRLVRPTLLRRLVSEIWLARTASANDVVLCFGNLPPLLRVRARVILFIQNRYLVDPVSLGSFGLGRSLRLWVERLWLRLRVRVVDSFIVQTESMRHVVIAQGFAEPSKVSVVPFLPQVEASEIAGTTANTGAGRGGFLYVASGEPHKNHRRLVEAWSLLAMEGICPPLYLTLDETTFAELRKLLPADPRPSGPNIINLGILPRADVLRRFSSVDALIYPSMFEAYGIPLLEARGANLPIIASELDYVRDVVEPTETFDPASALSIARAVKRFLGVDMTHVRPLTPKEFLTQMWLGGGREPA